MGSARGRQASEVLGVRLDVPRLLLGVREAWLLPESRVLRAAQVPPQLLVES